jgi:hypothetical protein
VVAVALAIVLAFVQAAETGTVIGLVKLPGGKLSEGAHVVLLPPKYTELWNRQVQQRIDNYWETFKPQLAVNKTHITDLYRLAHTESLRYVVATMRRDLGEGANKYIKETPANGQFEFRGISIGTYQLLVQASAEGETITWSRIVDVETNVPIFVDLGKPVS